MFTGNGEDRFLYERYFGDKKGAVFLEIAGPGAFGSSPTETFERIFDWRGLCIDTGKNGAAVFGNGRVADIVSYADDEIGEHLAARRLDAVDYCALRGGDSDRVVASLVGSGLRPAAFSLTGDPGRAMAAVAGHGYRHVASLPNRIQIFVRNDVPRRPAVTVICSVWHRDPARAQLLSGHRANLDRQTLPVERIYIFENGDIPPSGLLGRHVVAQHEMTIYEAWNLALAMVTTPYVMNLNLDDRLCTDAAARMESALDTGAHIVGGDWRVCFSQAETDDVTECQSPETLPVAQSPVPQAGIAARLGNATGDHKSLGHATMWRMSLHQEIPRLPTRCGDGTPIRAKGDALWWQLLKTAGKRLEFLPLIVGHYHFHPDQQAEYRYDGDHELRRARDTGLIVF